MTVFRQKPILIGSHGRRLDDAGRPLFESNSPTILFLDSKSSHARELRLELTGAAAAIADEFKAALQSAGEEIEFLPTPKGLAILVCPESTVLWVPKADLDAALAEINQRNPQPERFEVAALTRFDRDKNGWLDDAERRAMRQDAVWKKEEQQTIDAAIRKAIQQHGAEWDLVFAKADHDGNGKLSSFELAAAATNHPALFSDRLRGVNTGLGFAIRPFDLDNDMALNREEFRTFLAEPRLVAEVNRSADWVTRFRLKVEECDLNNDGILDSKERLTVNRLINQRFTGKAAK